MKRFVQWAMAAVVALAGITSGAAPVTNGTSFAAVNIRAGDVQGVTGHVQGMCAADDAIFLSTHNAIVKADWAGKVLGIRRFAPHMGDLAWHKGRIYCTWACRKGKACEATLLVLDGELKEIARKVIPDIPGIDGITVLGDRIYFGVGEGNRQFHRVNRLGMADLDLNVIGYRDVDYGVETNFGVQNMCVFGGHIYAFFYTHLGEKKGSPLKCCVLDKNLKILSAERFTSTQGIDLAPARFGGTRERPVFVKSHAPGNVAKDDPSAVRMSVTFWTFRGGKDIRLSR